MPWKTMEVREQRVRFVVAALRRERSLSSFCQEFGISRPTGRLWLERYRAGGVEATAERSRRPQYTRGRPRRSWSVRWWHFACATPTGERVSFGCCWAKVGFRCRPARFIASCFVMHGCTRRTSIVRHRNASSEPRPTSCGRWISKGRSRGTSPCDRYRYWMITAVT